MIFFVRTERLKNVWDTFLAIGPAGALAIFLALAEGATQRASWLVKLGKGGLGDVDKKIQFIYRKRSSD